MYLNAYEERILKGERGFVAEKCMKFLTKYGDAAGAERLIDIDGTVDLHPGKMSSWYPETAVTMEEIVELASRGNILPFQPSLTNLNLLPS